MNRSAIRLSLILLAVSFGLALAASHGPPATAATVTRFVSLAGKDSGDCIASPCLTISFAVKQANAGDVISVAGGVYREGVVVTKSVVLAGNGATIDATGKDNGIMVQGAAAAGTGISGFTVTNATFEGILVQQTSGVSVRNNTVTNNDLGVKAAHPVGPCVGQGEVPGDCGEGLHLQTVTNSVVDSNTLQNNQGGILLTDEMGPTVANTISNNSVSNNPSDCGITLASHSFHLGSPVDPATGGIYRNVISGNTISGSGQSGVGLFAAPPGASVYANTITGNTITGNGIPGVALHSHAPFQNVNDNVIDNNVISKNGADPDEGLAQTAGIGLITDPGAAPLQTVTIKANTISNEQVGIYIASIVAAPDLSSNIIDKTVTTPSIVKVVSAAAPASAAPPSGAPAAAPAAAPTGVTIQPPNTGDAGLERSTSPTFYVGLALMGVVLAGALGFMRRRLQE